jgi:hypothetical protein
MADKKDLIDVSDILKKSPLIFSGTTYVTKMVFEKIIKPTENIYALLDNPEDRLLDLVKTGHPGESCDIDKPHPANQSRNFQYVLHTIEGDRVFSVKCEVNFFAGERGEITIKMADE